MRGRGTGGGRYLGAFFLLGRIWNGKMWRGEREKMEREREREEGGGIWAHFHALGRIRDGERGRGGGEGGRSGKAFGRIFLL